MRELLRGWITAAPGIEGQLCFAVPEEALRGWRAWSSRRGNGPLTRTTVMRSSTLSFPLGRMGAPAEWNSVAFGWPGGGGSYAGCR